MEQPIDRFYAAFDRKDGDAMAACYAPGARFSDPPSASSAARSPARCGGCSRRRRATSTLGTPGLLLGWTPMLRASVRRRARGNLERFMAGGA